MRDVGRSAYDRYRYSTDVGWVEEFALFDQTCKCGSGMHPVIRLIQPEHKEYIPYLVAQCPWCNRRAVASTMAELAEAWDEQDYENEDEETNEDEIV